MELVFLIDYLMTLSISNKVVFFLLKLKALTYSYLQLDQKQSKNRVRFLLSTQFRLKGGKKKTVTERAKYTRKLGNMSYIERVILTPS
jgi:hypothetical protein